MTPLTALLAWSPEAVLALAGAGVLVYDAIRPGNGRVERWLTLGALAVAFSLALLVAANSGSLYGIYFSGTLRVDAITTYGRLLFMSASALVVLSSWRTAGEGNTAEYYGLLLLSFLGESVIVSAQSLLMLFLGIEMLALPSYALMAIRRHARGAVRAALKYFLLGTFASIVMLYGTALVYGAVRSVSYVHGLFPDPAALGTARAGLAMLAFFFVFLGIGFKVTAFPFHFWAPDVYASGSTPVVAYVATVPKVAVMLALWRMLGPDFAHLYPVGATFLAIIAVASMVYGNVVALLQDDVRRMLAYSGVANTGYMLIAFVAGGGESLRALMFFLVVYTFANLGVFFVAMVLGPDTPVAIADFHGLAKRSGPLAFAMAICLFSLAGTPPLAGFFGKLALFKVAVDAGLGWIALIALVTTVISVGYYLRIASQMYGDLAATGEGAGEAAAASPAEFRGPLRLAVFACAGASVLLGVLGIAYFTS